MKPNAMPAFVLNRTKFRNNFFVENFEEDITKLLELKHGSGSNYLQQASKPNLRRWETVGSHLWYRIPWFDIASSESETQL
ncbi:hypothetical protein BpHYR1_023698 [Brachionus plicatilis]|uniref:Uncharacterized protein n=1 Tax=Brachionus plicatilis TaxID=10195 RepID=A0A3M7QHF7_BRAPC|nr:hypothetical protein BpHYR1_023698 [Brachionus plicatilis]